MPIVINHQPSAASLARVGYQTGAGQYAQEQQRLQQQERMQMRSIAAQQQMAMFQAQQANQRAMFGANVRRDEQMQAQQFERDMRQEEIKLRMMQDDHRREAEEDLLNMQFENAEQTDQRRYFQTLSSNRMGMIDEALTDGMGYTEDEQRIVDSIRGQLDELTKNQNRMTPLQFAMARQSLVDRMPIPTQPSVTPQEQFNESIVTIGEGEDAQYFIPNGRGGWDDVTPKPDPKKLEMQHERMQQNMPPSARFYADPKEVNNLVLKAIEALTPDLGELATPEQRASSQVSPEKAADFIDKLFKQLDENWKKRKKESPQFGQEFTMDAEGNIAQ